MKIKAVCSLLVCVVLSSIALLSGCNSTKKEPTAETPAPTGATTLNSEARPAPNPFKNAYFGDLHLHTGYSMDAFAFGTRTTPEESYKYAMGETVDYMGKPQKRIAPLDFLAVTDHAEYLGVVRDTIDPNGPFAKTPWYATMTSTDPKVSGEAFKKLIGSLVVNKPIPEFNDPALHMGDIRGDRRQVQRTREIHRVHWV